MINVSQPSLCCFSTLWLLTLLFFASSAQSANHVMIWPMDPVLTANDNATEFWIENKGTEPTTMQIRVIGWQQIDGQDRYSNQQNVVASPPFMRIEAGQKQLIRLIKQATVPAGKEIAYRLLADEILKPEQLAAPKIGINMQMRYSISLFVYGEGINYLRGSGDPIQLDQKYLSWHLTRLNGKPAIKITNRGPIHARLSQVVVQQGKKRIVLANSLFGYVLAGSSYIWPLPTTIKQPQRLTAQINTDKQLWQASSTGLYQ
ncbi:molecular chaperone [Arsenophonus endosymbiont of Aphis craccivora]|uniref:fimbrial biogenesis chaperone n=1 Tax=Arsenophonus endosymbiont of Aphis craccivora TaxID=1231049 RepID=UPI0015DCF246|nr:molecular chaperone [Arsenophonus endosymbiont of Aphis craccivora]QLK87892.1 molecular chaperone [Arsenophonus endosymbiont of Aphis craccivora]